MPTLLEIMTDLQWQTSYYCYSYAIIIIIIIIIILSIALSCAMFKLINAEEYDMKSRLLVTEDHWKWHHSLDCIRGPTDISQ